MATKYISKTLVFLAIDPDNCSPDDPVLKSFDDKEVEKVWLYASTHKSVGIQTDPSPPKQLSRRQKANLRLKQNRKTTTAEAITKDTVDQRRLHQLKRKADKKEKDCRRHWKDGISKAKEAAVEFAERNIPVKRFKSAEEHFNHRNNTDQRNNCRELLQKAHQKAELALRYKEVVANVKQQKHFDTIQPNTESEINYFKHKTNRLCK